jgi:ribosome biogenesis GTPase
MESFDLVKLGWNDFFAQHFSSLKLKSASFEIGRVALENRHQYLLYTKSGEIIGETTGRLLHHADTNADLPKVGDWVAFTPFPEEEKAIIHEVLPRKSIFSRKVVGRKVEEQVVATNVDTVFIVQALDNDFNLRRLERYLIMVHEGKAKPVIVLNKIDLCENPEEKIEELKKAVGTTPVISVSAKTGIGISELKSFIYEGLTYAFTGSSGVGKSTLLNKLFAQEIQKTHDVRESDSRGRHTTTTRKMFILPEGGLLIDTPGMRELQLWYGEEGLSDTFSDFDELSTTCHFSNCTHTKEIKCSVLEALAQGELSAERYESFMKLRKESEALAAKQSVSKYIERKQETKRAQKAYNKNKRYKDED